MVSVATSGMQVLSMCTSMICGIFQGNHRGRHLTSLSGKVFSHTQTGISIILTFVRSPNYLPIDHFGKDSEWQAAIDIDEYPFSSGDTDPGFMHRFVKKYNEEHSDVSEITMQNYLYLGEKNKSGELLIEQLWRHTHGPSNNLVKPIYKPTAIGHKYTIIIGVVDLQGMHLTMS